MRRDLLSICPNGLLIVPDVPNRINEKTQKCNFTRWGFLYHGSLSFGKTDTRSAPTALVAASVLAMVFAGGSGEEVDD
jgi:hypothetical protein